MSKSITVLFLGPASTLTGKQRDQCEVRDDARLGDLVGELMTRYERLAPMRKSLRFAINQEFASDEILLSDGDEVAVIPPVSGGGPPGVSISLEKTPLDLAQFFAEAQGDDRAGGVACFVGTTRTENHPQRGRIVHLEYHVYHEMALKELAKLADQATERWPVLTLKLAHRVGDVALGQASVAILVSCPHRAEAFEACRWLIDALKVEVPIWKKEIWSDGTSTWVDPTAKGETNPHP